MSTMAQQRSSVFALNVMRDTRRSNELMVQAKSLPIMLRINGFYPTWAHLCMKRSKSEVARTLLLILAEHLHNTGCVNLGKRDGAGDFAEAALSRWLSPNSPSDGLDSEQLGRVTAASIDLAEWLKRAAEVYSAAGDDIPGASRSGQ